MLDNWPLNGPSNYTTNFRYELESEKSKRVKLMGLLQYFSDVEVLELNGFVRFRLDGRVVLLNYHL